MAFIAEHPLSSANFSAEYHQMMSRVVRIKSEYISLNKGTVNRTGQIAKDLVKKA